MNQKVIDAWGLVEGGLVAAVSAVVVAGQQEIVQGKLDYPTLIGVAVVAFCLKIMPSNVLKAAVDNVYAVVNNMHEQLADQQKQNMVLSKMLLERANPKPSSPPSFPDGVGVMPATATATATGLSATSDVRIDNVGGTDATPGQTPI